MQKIPYRLIFTILALIVTIFSVYNTIIIARQTSDENLYANQKRGVVFIQITPGGVSDDAGLRVGDRLVEINGVEIQSALSLPLCFTISNKNCSSFLKNYSSSKNTITAGH